MNVKVQTIEQYLYELPEPLNLICLEVAEENRLKQRVVRQSLAIRYMCKWSNTELGYDFFSKLYYDIAEQESLMPESQKFKKKI